MKQLKEQLYINKITQRGFMLLCLLLFMGIIFIPELYVILFPNENIKLVIEEVKAIEQENELVISDTIIVNRVTAEQLVNIGLGKEVAERWMNYRKAFDGFSSVDEVKKIYGLNEKDYKKLKPWLKIEETAEIEHPIEQGVVYKEHPVKKEEYIEKHKHIQWKKFNPNSVTTEELIQLGLSPRTAATWMNYKKAIGGYTSLSQIKDIYGVDTSWFNHAMDYIYFPGKEKKYVRDDDKYEERAEQSVHKKEFAIPYMIDLNKAGVAQWDSFPGIDKEIAERIVKYRYSIDGFDSVDDLSHVYGLPEDFVKTYAVHLTLHKSETEILNLNTASIDELKKIPHINFNQARSIVNYRDQHGKFDSIDDLRRIRTLSSEVIAELEGVVVLK